MGGVGFGRLWGLGGFLDGFGQKEGREGREGVDLGRTPDQIDGVRYWNTFSAYRLASADLARCQIS